MKVLIREGEQKVVTTGFSWTVFFFGVFVPLFRGDGMGFLIQLVLGFCTCGLSWLVIPFTYNNAYEQRLRNNGWKTLK
tara:strand:- start:1002 stop:1235 length:234 start_codon:yes stop_codon:yes gene_type:complete